MIRQTHASTGRLTTDEPNLQGMPHAFRFRRAKQYTLGSMHEGHPNPKPNPKPKPTPSPVPVPNPKPSHKQTLTLTLTLLTQQSLRTRSCRPPTAATPRCSYRAPRTRTPSCRLGVGVGVGVEVGVGVGLGVGVGVRARIRDGARARARVRLAQGSAVGPIRRADC